MIPSWFSTREQVDALRRLAESLIGTPFMANSEAPGKGGGIDCVRLNHYIYRTFGVLPFVSIPAQAMDHGHHSERSLLVEAFETWPDLVTRFRRLPDCKPENLLPGDALCFQSGKVPHHGGVMLDRGELLHALRGAGVHTMQLNAAVRGWKILGELRAVYRPIPDDYAG